MKPFERLYLVLEPGLPVLYRRVRKTLLAIASQRPAPIDIIDIGGRKSHYTVGVPARVTVTDVERQTGVQHSLHLGINAEITAQIQKRRSNIARVVLDDMTQSGLESRAFDCAVAVEVLEHVDQDRAFVREVCRVLKPDGVFVMTTPNGDYVKNTNPDHKRHYRRAELEELLRREFHLVDVRYAIPGGKFYTMALESWSVRRPWKTARAMAAAMMNAFEDRRAQHTGNGNGMQELVAIARKAG